MNHKSLTVAVLATLSILGLHTFAQSDQQLVDEVNKLTPQPAASKSWEYQSFESCEDYETVLQEFLDENEQLFQRGGYYPYAIDDMMMEDLFDADVMVEEAEAVAAPQATNAKVASDDFSTTNLQVSGVDEADILKTDGEFFYYYSAELGKIYVLEYGNGLDGGDLSDALSSIQVPKTLSNVQMFLQDETLTIVANRRSQASQQGLLDNGQKTVVSVFDVSDPTSPKLDAFHDLDGYTQDSRMIDGELTLITGLSVNRWRRHQNSQAGKDTNLSTLRPTQRSVVYDADAALDIDGRDYPYSLTSSSADCQSIQYLFPDAETLQQSNVYPSFTTVYTIDTTSDDEIDQTILFGNTEQIHMSQRNLYLTSSQYISTGSSCPIGARCLFPSFGSQQTLIHKYELDGMEYDGSALIDGAPLPQWSMSESSDEEFRILTRQWSPQSATHLAILDDDLDLRGSILNIEPGEEFKASRYIGDKLYLVTFEQIDPLFVIDLEDSRDPQILGELKIPGYSTYLHPYDTMTDGVQHLIGLGYDTTPTQRGGITTAGVKVDLYTVDYNQSPLSIVQTHTLTMGDQDSWTEVTENPRAFVRNPTTKSLLLPVVLTDSTTGSNCQVFYDANGQEETRECYETTRTSTSFAGLKTITIDLENGINESSLVDLKPLLNQFKNLDRYGYYEDDIIEESEDDDTPLAQISPRVLRQLMMRAGYIGDEAYLFTNQSVTFTDGSVSQSVLLDR